MTKEKNKRRQGSQTFRSLSLEHSLSTRWQPGASTGESCFVPTHRYAGGMLSSGADECCSQRTHGTVVIIWNLLALVILHKKPGHQESPRSCQESSWHGTLKLHQSEYKSLLDSAMKENSMIRSQNIKLTKDDRYRCMTRAHVMMWD